MCIVRTTHMHYADFRRDSYACVHSTRGSSQSTSAHVIHFNSRYMLCILCGNIYAHWSHMCHVRNGVSLVVCVSVLVGVLQFARVGTLICRRRRRRCDDARGHCVPRQTTAHDDIRSSSSLSLKSLADRSRLRALLCNWFGSVRAFVAYRGCPRSAVRRAQQVPGRRTGDLLNCTHSNTRIVAYPYAIWWRMSNTAMTRAFLQYTCGADVGSVKFMGRRRRRVAQTRNPATYMRLAI